MRKEFWILLIVNGSIVLFLLYQVFDLITLLHDGSKEFQLTQDEFTPVQYTEVATMLPNGTETTIMQPDRPLLIPKIIHQTYKTSQVPEKWQATHQTVKDLHPDYEHILWTDEMARDFISEHYSWFLPTFDSYPYNIMRADVIRYFVLSHYGGVYIDLDNGCLHNIDPLLAMPAWLRKTDPTGVSNDLMGARPHHPFFAEVINNLKRYNHNMLVPYITIMYSTGPLMLSVLWKQYTRWGVAKGNEVRLLMPEAGTNHQSYFFYQGKSGSSWHQGDAQLMFVLLHHWFLATIIITAAVFFFFYLQYKLYQRISVPSLSKLKRWVARPFQIALRAGQFLPWSSRSAGPDSHSKRGDHNYLRLQPSSRSASPFVAYNGGSGSSSSSGSNSGQLSPPGSVFSSSSPCNSPSLSSSDWDDKDVDIYIDSAAGQNGDESIETLHLHELKKLELV